MSDLDAVHISALLEIVARISAGHPDLPYIAGRAKAELLKLNEDSAPAPIPEPVAEPEPEPAPVPIRRAIPTKDLPHADS